MVPGSWPGPSPMGESPGQLAWLQVHNPGDSFLWRELFTRDFGQGRYGPLCSPYPYSHSQSICPIKSQLTYTTLKLVDLL